MGATKIPEFPSTYVFPSYGHLALVVYVDDFVLSGDSSYHDSFWADLSKRIMLDDIGDLGRFLGDIIQQWSSEIKNYSHSTCEPMLRALSMTMFD